LDKLTRFAAFTLLGLLAAFVAYVFWDSGRGAGTSQISGSPSQINSFAFKSHTECRECHPQYYEEWQRSFHAQAWTDPWVKQSWACYADQDCKNCHAPMPVMLNGRKPTLAPRTDDLESGVNCLTCHMSPQGVMAPEERQITMAKSCAPVKNDLIATDAMCWECHPNQYDDWRGTSFYKKGQGCKSCHMDQMDRPLVPNGPTRKTRVHFWKGAHTFTFIKTAYDFKFVPTPKGLEVTLMNTKSGHFFPAERHNRALWVEVFFYDDKGAQVGDMVKWTIREGSNLPRNVRSLDIKPDAQVSNLFPYPVASGKAKVTLKFDYFYADEDEYTRILEDPAPVAFKKAE